MEIHDAHRCVTQFRNTGGGVGWGGFDLKNQALGFELGRKKHLLSQEKLQLASLAFVIKTNLCNFGDGCLFVTGTEGNTVNMQLLCIDQF